MPESFADPLRYEGVNDGGTACILDAAWSAGVRRVVLAGSAAVYGEGGERPLREEDPFDPRSPYAASKVAMEALGRVYAHRGMALTILRYFNVYGPGSTSQAVVPRFVRRATAGLPLEIEGDGHQLRDFVHVDDVARANVLALYGQAGTINIGSGVGRSILELGQRVRAHHVRCELRFVPAREQELRKSVADIRRAQDLLGWVPRIELEEGLVRLLRRGLGVHLAAGGS